MRLCQQLFILLFLRIERKKEKVLTEALIISLLANELPLFCVTVSAREREEKK